MAHEPQGHWLPPARGRLYQATTVELSGRGTYWYLVLHAQPQMVDVICGMN